MDMQKIIATVDTWPVEDRLRLIESLWDRLSGRGIDLEPTEDFKAELDRRIDDLDRNPDSVVPWEVVEARALARFQK